MKQLATIIFMVSFLSVFAQVKMVETVQLDTLTKIIGIGLTIGGFFMGYMQMRMANKIAEVEAKFNKAIVDVKDVFGKKIETETEKLEGEIKLSGKEIEAKMATRHDIENVKTVIKMQHEITNLQLDSLKGQLKTAADIYQRETRSSP